MSRRLVKDRNPSWTEVQPNTLVKGRKLEKANCPSPPPRRPLRALSKRALPSRRNRETTTKMKRTMSLVLSAHSKLILLTVSRTLTRCPSSASNVTALTHLTFPSRWGRWVKKSRIPTMKWGKMHCALFNQITTQWVPSAEKKTLQKRWLTLMAASGPTPTISKIWEEQSSGPKWLTLLVPQTPLKAYTTITPTIPSSELQLPWLGLPFAPITPTQFWKECISNLLKS